MAQQTSTIHQTISLTQQTLEHFKDLVNKTSEKIPEEDINELLSNLKQQLDSLRTLEFDAKSLANVSTKLDKELTDSEKKILDVIAHLQKNPRSKEWIGNIGNIRTGLSLFLNQVKEQIVRIEKKRKKVDPAEKGEFGNL